VGIRLTKMARTTLMLSYALAPKVLCVAVVNYESNVLFDWACYIDAVQGFDHNIEMEYVKLHGTKQPKEIAQLLFSHLPIEKYRS